MFRGIELTEEQKTRIKQLHQSFGERTKSLREQLRAKRQELRQAEQGDLFNEALAAQKLTEAAALQAKLMGERSGCGRSRSRCSRPSSGRSSNSGAQQREQRRGERKIAAASARSGGRPSRCSNAQSHARRRASAASSDRSPPPAKLFGVRLCADELGTGVGHGAGARSRGGDESAFAEIVRRYGPRVFRVAGRFFRQREQVEEAAQEVFLKAFTQLDTYEGRGSFEGWLTRIATTTCLNLLRSAKRRPELTVSDLTEDEGAWLETHTGGRGGRAAARGRARAWSRPTWPSACWRRCRRRPAGADADGRRGAAGERGRGDDGLVGVEGEGAGDPRAPPDARGGGEAARVRSGEESRPERFESAGGR